MRLFRRAGVVALLLVAVGATRSYSGPHPEVSDWDVSGLHNLEGAYAGTARITLDTTSLDVTVDVSCQTSSGKALAWTARGSLGSGKLDLTLDHGAKGFALQIPGATASDTSGHAGYVLGDPRTISGYWQLTSKTKKVGKAKVHAGGTETLTLRSGKPLLPSAPKLPPPRLPADALPVPLVTQPDDYSCGAASLQSVLYYYRVSGGNLRDIYKPLKTSEENGTEPPEIVAFARQRGLTASFAEGKSLGLADLRDALWRRDPVMLVIQAWRVTTTPWKDDVDDPHWVVLVGMDADYAYFMDPWAHFGYGFMPLSELLERWHCAEDNGHGGLKTVQHEAIFFHGFAPPANGLVRMQ